MKDANPCFRQFSQNSDGHPERGARHFFGNVHTTWGLNVLDCPFRAEWAASVSLRNRGAPTCGSSSKTLTTTPGTTSCCCTGLHGTTLHSSASTTSRATWPRVAAASCMSRRRPVRSHCCADRKPRSRSFGQRWPRRAPWRHTCGCVATSTPCHTTASRRSPRTEPPTSSANDCSRRASSKTCGVSASPSRSSSPGCRT
jgi:hypothetical protein